MKTLNFTFILLFSFAFTAYAQYTETFDLANKGILTNNIDGSCTGSGTSCSAFDFDGVDWTLDGNLTGVDLEGLFTKSGYLHFEDVDEEACWVSPILDISASPASAFNVEFTIPAEATWDNTSTTGSADYADIEYSVDGGAFVALGNVNSCAGSGHTLSGIGCGGVSGPATFNIGQGGIAGSTLRIRVCVDINAASDDGWLETVSTTGAIILPVTWSSVTVSDSKRGAHLKWSTSSEENSDLFQVERMNLLTKEFELIGEISAAGFSSEELDYEFIDSEESSNQVNYYRIKQVDFNGEYTYSDLVSLRRGGITKLDIAVFPNPAINRLQIETPNEVRDQITTAKIYNILGALESQLNLANNPAADLSLDVSNLSSGLYFIQFEDANQFVLGSALRFQKIGM